MAGGETELSRANHCHWIYPYLHRVRLDKKNLKFIHKVNISVVIVSYTADMWNTSIELNIHCQMLICRLVGWSVD